jgi:hypothetical protein
MTSTTGDPRSGLGSAGWIMIAAGAISIIAGVLAIVGAIWVLGWSFVMFANWSTTDLGHSFLGLPHATVAKAPGAPRLVSRAQR